MIFGKKQNKCDMKIFILPMANCTGNAYTTWASISVLIRDGFRACFVVPEVVPTILHFGDTVAVLTLAKNVLFLFVRKIHEVTPMHFLTSPHSLCHIFIMAGVICL